MIRRLIPLILATVLGLSPVAVRGQADQVVLAGQRQPTRLTLTPLYQRVEQDSLVLKEFSTMVFAFLPIHRNLAAGLRINHAATSGNGLTSADGLTDAQASLAYTRDVRRARLLVSFTVNLPSGKQHFTPDEFRTVSLVALNEYGFQIPSFGQGIGLTPAVTLALPLSEDVVAGFGAVYQYRGSYEPLADMTDTYNPGNEVLLTGGLDVRLGPTTTLATDLSFAVYGTDRLGTREVFASGSKTSLSARLRHTPGRREVWVMAVYRSRAKNSLAVDGVLVTEVEKTTPDQLEVIGRYQFPLHPRFYLGVRVEASYFEARPYRRQETVRVGAGLVPEVIASRSVRIPMRFTYLTGDLSGFDIGIGLRLRM